MYKGQTLTLTQIALFNNKDIFITGDYENAVHNRLGPKVDEPPEAVSVVLVVIFAVLTCADCHPRDLYLSSSNVEYQRILDVQKCHTSCVGTFV